MKVAAGATGSVQKREGEAGRAASTKTILDGISGRAVPGELLAIMGPSGAGKTSLLNCLSHRNTGFEGKVLVNKKPLSDQTFASITAYMHQTELFLPDLTVREHLAFKARLQLDPSMSSAERAQRVSKVIFQLGLQESADVQIGWPNGDGRGAGGISRNERKRLNFATEIISEPSLLFVDEPTTGLDSHMAESVVRQLRRLADPDDDDDDDEGNGEWEEKDKGGNASSGDSARRSNTGQRRTVIATIHQPSSDIFRLFHRLLLLVDGRVAYQGPAAAVADYFARIEYPVPDYVNPADFLMRLFVDPQRPDESMRNRATICDAYTALPASSALATCAAALPPGAAGFDPPPRYTTSCCRQLAELTARDVRMRARSKLALRTALARTVVLGVFFGLLFLRYDVDQASFAFVNVCLFFLVFIPGLTTAMTMTQELPAMMPTVLREHKGGSYHVGVYILSKYLVDVPYDGVLCLMWAAIIYWMAGFGAWSGRTFFLFFLIVWLTGYAFAGIGYMASACTRDPNVATIILIAVMIPSMLFGGLMIPLNAMPVFLGWLAELSTVRYGFELMMRAQWQDYGEIPCPASIAPSPLGQTAVDHVVGGNTTTMPSPSPSGEVGRAGGAAATASVRSPRCPPLTGSLVISKTGMSEGAATMWRMVGLLIGWAFLFRLIAALCLVRRARRSQAMGTIADTHQSLRGGGDNDGGDSGGGDGGGGGGKIKKEGVNGEAGGGRGGDGSTDPVGNDNDQSGGVAAAAPPGSGRGDDEAAAATSTSVIAVARREAAEEEAELDVAAPVQPEENDNAPAAAAAAVVETETKAREPAIALTVGRMEEGGGDKDEGQVHVEKMRVMGTREDKVEVLLQWRDLSFAVRRARPSGGKDKAATKTGKKTRPNAAAVVDEGGPTTAATTTSGSSSSSSSASSEFRVLDRVSGEAAPGEMVAVMGPSGCGKSTLLQCLAMRQVPTGGAVTMNGEPAASVADSMRRHTAFMHQEERFFGLLTVREHLQFQARLRMDATLPLGRRLAVVEACIDELGLGKCAATQIGEIGAGISGGERKRLSFATEMLVDPSVFLSDEPTSGLDSSMAESVVGYMRALARGLPGQGIPRRTIVVTIHQPSAEIFALFDKLVILARGRVAFFGKAADALGYFDSLAQPGGGAIDGLTVCPKDTNPADHFMRLISTLVDDKAASTLAAAATDSEDGGSGNSVAIVPAAGSLAAALARVDFICNAWIKHVVEQHASDDQAGGAVGSPTSSSPSSPSSSFSAGSYDASFCKQFTTLLRREALIRRRSRMMFKAVAARTLFIGVLFGLIYLQMARDGSLAMRFAVSGAFMMMMMNTAFTYGFGLVQEMPLLLRSALREHRNHMYGLVPYILARWISDLPVDAIMVLVFSGLTFGLMGLRNFGVLYVINLLVAFTSASVAYMSVFIGGGNGAIAFLIFLALAFLWMMVCGFMLPPNLIPPGFAWVEYTSFFRYAFEAYLVNHWDGIEPFSCTPSPTAAAAGAGATAAAATTTTTAILAAGNQTPAETGGKPCDYRTGTEVITALGMDPSMFSFDLILLFSLGIICRCIAIAALLFHTRCSKTRG